MGIILVGLRACSSLRIFEPFRVQIQLFKQVFIDIIWFMSILVMLVVLMAIVYGVEYAMAADESTKKASTDSMRLNFFNHVGKFYMFMNGELPYEDEMSTTAWIVYVIFTLLVQIVALNLLIAILSETFTNVYATMKANHCRTKVEILKELSSLKCFLPKDEGPKY